MPPPEAMTPYYDVQEGLENSGMTTANLPLGKAKQDIVLSENDKVRHQLVRAQSEALATASSSTRYCPRAYSCGNVISSPNSSKILQISDSTRRLIENMDNGQIQNAYLAFEAVNQKRKELKKLIDTFTPSRILTYFHLDGITEEEEEKGQLDGTVEPNEAISSLGDFNQALEQAMSNIVHKLSRPIAALVDAPLKPRKRFDGATIFRRGKRKADKCLFLEAVELFNFALEKQREELGKDHIDCATTLNEIGNAWMMLDEKYAAL